MKKLIFLLFVFVIQANLHAWRYFPEGTKWTEIRLDTLKYNSWHSKVGDEWVPNYETIEYRVQGEYIDERFNDKYSCIFTNGPEWADSLTLLIYGGRNQDADWFGGIAVAAFDDDGQLSWPCHGQMYPLSWEVGTIMRSLSINMAGITGFSDWIKWNVYGTVEEIKEGDFGGVRPLKYSDVNGIRFIQGIGVASWNDGECIFGPIRPYEVLSALGAVEDEQRHYRSMLVHFERDGEVLYNVWPAKEATTEEPITFTEGQMATIVLPIEPDASKGKFYRLDRVEEGKIVFEQELQPHAHVPYIIVPNEDFSIDLNNMDLEGCSPDTVSIKVRFEGQEESQSIYFIGSYVSEELEQQEGCNIQFIDTTPDCSISFSEETGKRAFLIGALRAYLTWDDPIDHGGAQGRGDMVRVLRVYGTSIEEMKNEELRSFSSTKSMKNDVFDLSGRKIVNGTPRRQSRLGSKESKNLPQGIYIENGVKKVTKQ